MIKRQKQKNRQFGHSLDFSDLDNLSGIMDSFTLKPLPQIEFGFDSINSLPEHIRERGGSVLLLTGADSLKHYGNRDPILSLLDEGHLDISLVEICHEPSPQLIDSIVQQHTAQKIDVVTAIGGGSVVDAGKAVSAMLPHGEAVKQYLEGVGCRRPTGEKIPFIAIPTTAGTGSEVTSNAVISQSGKDGFKKSLRHDRYIPDLALIDPLLMRSCPPEITAACGLDTFSQLVEAYLSTKSSPVTDAIAWKGIQSVHQSLFRVYQEPEDIYGRSQMALASLCSGIVLMNAGLGVVHGLAPALGCLFPISHGAVCGTLMAAANDITLRKLEVEQQNNEALLKYTKLGKLCSTKADKSDEYYRKSFIEYLHSLTRALKIPRLSQFDVRTADLGEIAAASSNKNNPAALTHEEMLTILENRL